MQQGGGEKHLGASWNVPANTSKTTFLRTAAFKQPRVIVIKCGETYAFVQQSTGAGQANARFYSGCYKKATGDCATFCWPRATDAAAWRVIVGENPTFYNNHPVSVYAVMAESPRFVGCLDNFL